MKYLFCILTLFFTAPLFAEESQDTPQPVTRGLNHLGLSVKDLDVSTLFFTEVLGWRKVGGDPEYPASFLSDGELFLTLWQVDQEKAVDFNRKTNVGLHHLALTVPSFEALDALHEKLKTVEGVVIEFAPELAYGGPTKHMMVREPSGNRLEFAHNPPKQE